MVEEILSVFPDAKIHSGYAQIRCPYHADGKERKPSMSILLEPKQTMKGVLEAGFCHCFACGKVVHINDLLQFIGQKPIADTAKHTVLRPKDMSLTTTPPVYKPSLPFRFSDYLYKRGISRETQEKFRIYEKDKKVYMPVFDRSGRYLYANARSIEGKQFYVESGATKTLWGIEEIDFSRPIAVCESQIDALSFWEVGVQAVATLGADNISALNLIRQVSSTIILAFDPDEAGRRARDNASAMLGKFRCRWLDLPEGVDVNQALQDIRDKDKFKNFMYRCMKQFRT